LDESSFAAYCCAYATWRIADERLAQEDIMVPGERHDVANPLLKIAAQAARDLIKFGGEFGLSPSSRARVAAGMAPPSSTSKFGDLLA
jgi:P27 family predicted phage terminase small subunit